MYIYEGHMRSLFVSDEVLDYEQLYCETCGDSDTLIGYADNREDAERLLESYKDIFDEAYIKKFLDEYF